MRSTFGRHFGFRPPPVTREPPERPDKPEKEKQSKPPCDSSADAVKREAEDVTKKISGATLGTRNGEPAINFKGGFQETAKRLRSAGYYTGILAYNPLDHAGGLEFRTYGSPGFHFKVLYPDVKEVQVGGRMGVKVSDARAVATDLHIDCHNPVGQGIGETLEHGADLIRSHTPLWLPQILFSPRP